MWGRLNAVKVRADDDVVFCRFFFILIVASVSLFNLCQVYFHCFRRQKKHRPPVFVMEAEVYLLTGGYTSLSLSLFICIIFSIYFFTEKKSTLLITFQSQRRTYILSSSRLLFSNLFMYIACVRRVIFVSSSIFVLGQVNFQFQTVDELRVVCVSNEGRIIFDDKRIYMSVFTCCIFNSYFFIENKSSCVITFLS